MKRILAVLTLILAATASFAAPAPKKATTAATPEATPAPVWKKQVIADFQLTQSSFDNWVQGGDDSLAWQAGLKSRFTREVERSVWVNTLDFAYGRTRLEGQESQKTVDEVKAESVYTLKLGGWLDPFAAVSGRTQMTAGYLTVAGARVKTSGFLDTGYFMESVGVGYRKGDAFTSRLGAALRETVTRDFPGYADDPKTLEIEKTKVEAGATWVTEYKQKLGTASLFTSKLDLFSNLKAADQMVVRWDNVLSTKITKLFTFGAEVDLFYDRNLSRGRQLKQFLSAGFTYSLL